MTQQLLSPKVAIFEETPNVRSVQPAPTAVTGCVGITERGPFGPTLVTSFEEYLRSFGGYTSSSDVALAAKCFFENGGQFLWISRVVHYSDNTDPTSKTSSAATATLLTAALASTAGTVRSSILGPYVLSNGLTLKAHIDGGGTLTATFSATAGHRDSGTETFVLANGNTLTLRVDGGSVQTVVFSTSQFADITAATALEVAAVINSTITGASAGVVSSKVRLTSDRLGTGSSINVTGGSGNGALGFATGTSGSTGTGNVSNILAVTAAEVVTIAGAAFTGSVVTNDGGYVRVTSNTLGASSSVHIDAASTAEVILGFDTATHSGNDAGTLSTLRADGKSDGAYGNNVTAVISTASNGDAAHFNFSVQQSGRTVEVFPNVTMDSTDASYVVSVVNAGSNLVAVTDLAAATSAPDNRPANVSSALTGGSDGLSSLADADYVGSVVTDAAFGTGLRAFDTVTNLGILIVPGRATAAVHNAMATYVEATRFGSVFAIMDPPAGQSAAQMVTYVTSTALLKQLTEFAAIYWPRVTIANPNATVFGNGSTITVPPSGMLAGLYARNDAKLGGVYEAPAGIDFGQLFGALGLENEEVKDETKRDLIFPENINPIVGLPGLPIHADGARCLKDTGPFPTVGERRGVIFIEQSLKSSLVFAKNRKIKPALLTQLARTTRAFLLTQLRLGAFASDDPKKAFTIDFGGGLNPPSEAFARRVNGRIGLATAKPAEFILLRVGQDTRALEEELAQAA